MREDILICIFNYRYDDNAKKWLHMLSPYFEIVVLDSGNDHIESEFIQFPNIYYSGLFNEMKKLSEKKRYKWIGMIPSDITLLSSEQELIDKINWLTTKNNIGLWQPSLDETSRIWPAYNVHNDNVQYESKKILEAHFLFIKKEILDEFDYIDLSINHLGYGVSEIISGLSMKMGYYNISDNLLLIHHPNEKGYIHKDARKECRIWAPMICEKYGLDYYYLVDVGNGHNNLGEIKIYE